jgi:hypothetical protein
VILKGSAGCSVEMERPDRSGRRTPVRSLAY